MRKHQITIAHTKKAMLRTASGVTSPKNFSDKSVVRPPPSNFGGVD